MFMYVFSIVLIVASNIVYNISQKSTPEKANPFLALLLTYATAVVITSIAYFFYRPDEGFVAGFKQLNWTSVALGCSVVGLEFGYLMAYRAGWQISVGTLVANIALALALILVGYFLYSEDFHATKLLGAAMCIGGLILLNIK